MTDGGVRGAVEAVGLGKSNARVVSLTGVVELFVQYRRSNAYVVVDPFVWGTATYEIMVWKVCVFWFGTDSRASSWVPVPAPHCGDESLLVVMYPALCTSFWYSEATACASAVSVNRFDVWPFKENTAMIPNESAPITNGNTAMVINSSTKVKPSSR